MRVRERRRKARAALRRAEERLVAYDSKVKMGILSVPCLGVAAFGLVGLVTGESLLGTGFVTHLAALAIASVTAFTLLQMGFDGRPVLVIDEDGIACRRPDLGLIPWRAVIAVGSAKAVMMRKVLMVAVDESELEEKARNHLRNRISLFTAFSRNVARFERQMSGNPSFHITISYFSMPIAEIEARTEALVHRYGPR